MAQLNFPDPAVTQTYTEAGITWTWNATLGVWSAEAGSGGDDFTQAEADGRYLRIDAGAPGQTRVSGEATFAELTTHEGGVSVTGSGSVQYGLNNISDVLQLRYESQPLVQLRKGGVDDYRVRFTARQQVEYAPVNDSPVFSILPTIAGQSAWNTDIFTVKPTLTGSFNSLIGLNLDFKSGIAGGTSITTNNFYGIKLSRTNQITAGTGKVYGVYTEVEGANNYNFYAAGDAPNYFAGETTIKGGATRGGAFIKATAWNDDVPRFDIFRNDSADATMALRVGHGATTSYSIRYDGSASYILPLARVAPTSINNAVDTIKAFTPTAEGFNAQDFIDYLPDAVDIDTLTADSVMVEKDRIIPLLTKALQEALERIEALEAQLNP